MKRSSRRAFLVGSARAGMGLATPLTGLAPCGAARAAASESLALAVVGVNGRGSVLARDFAARPDCRVAALADVDLDVAGRRSRLVEQAQGSAPKVVQDFRRVLDDKAIDAVVIATPDHWHALATVWACQAGKHVYVEKPASHSPWEGRKMVEAARKYRRVVQLGTQSRSAPYNRQAKEYIAAGRLGRIHLCKVFNQRLWPNPKPVPDRPAPSGLDWEMWLGPAPTRPYNPNVHRGWNHLWDLSGGDIINDGVHQMDLARWLIGRDYPRSVHCTGGRFDEAGFHETPDTQVAVYDFDGLVMTFELTLYTPYMTKTDLPMRNSDRYPYWPQNGTRIEIYGSDGLMVAGRHGDGWQVFGTPRDERPVVIAQGNGDFPDPEHKQDFVDAIRQGRRPSADIEDGHRSTLLCQYANISYRLGGQKLQIDPATEAITDCEAARAMSRRPYRAPWVVPEVV
jgi:predicted dehydrogenase